jgi:phosphosulfolactate synthase (CoM biosynthesis protein A)
MEVQAMKHDLESMGEYVDILKFSGGSFALMPKQAGGR